MSAAARPPGRAVEPRPDRTTLVDVLDTLLAAGVTVTGDVVLSVADVDLVHLGLRLVLRGLDGPVAGSAPAGAEGSNGGIAGPAGRPGPPESAHVGHPRGQGARGAPSRVGPDGGELELGEVAASELDRLVAAGRRGDAEPEDVQRGLAALVLTLVEVLRELMERQAVRRMDSGTLDDEETERLGRTFLALRERMEQLKEVFGLTDADLNLDLGPLGDLR